MILLAGIYRVSDGLPISASTDLHQTREMKECQKYIKMLSKRFQHLPDRCTLKLEGYNIHFITSMDLTFLVLCEASYPALLSFCFLDEIQKEFLTSYDRLRVQSLKRPYAYIEFDVYLQRTKQRYNNPRSLSTKINLADMSQEIKLRPPYEVQEYDVMVSNGIKHGSKNQKLSVSPLLPLAPVSWLGYAAVMLNILSALLNLTRGMAIISHGHFDEEDRGAYRYGTSFLVACTLILFQIYQVFHNSRWRKKRALLTFFSLLFCNYHVGHLRNWFQMLFYFANNLVITVIIIKRKVGKKSLDCLV